MEHTSMHIRLRLAREFSHIRQDDVVAELRQRGERLAQCDLSGIELGVRPLSSAMAQKIATVILTILEARSKAVRELLSATITKPGWQARP